MAAKAISCLAVFLPIFLSSARALASASEMTYELNGIPVLGLTGADFERLFDASSAGTARSEVTLPRVERPRAPAPRIKKAPFMIDIPAVAPAPYVRTFNRLKARRETSGYDGLIRSYALQKELDPRLVKSVIAAESEFSARARSPSGALGLMQIMPETAGSVGVPRKSLFDPAANIRAGTAYLAYLFERAWKRYHLQGVPYRQAPAWLVQRVVAAYNAGPRFLVHRRLYHQTREYVRRVLLFYRSPVTELRASV